MNVLGYNKTKEIEKTIKRFGIKCGHCIRLWMVGDRDRTSIEKKFWLCPDCIAEYRDQELAHQ